MSNTMPKSAALFEIIHPPDDLRKKVVVASGPEFNLDLVIAEMEMVLASQQDVYEESMRAQVNAFLDAAAAGELQPRRLFDTAHELRSMAGTFGFALLGRVAKSYCDYTDVLNGTAPSPAVARLHADAMRVALLHTGPIEAAGEAMLKGLSTLIAKAVAKP